MGLGFCHDIWSVLLVSHSYARTFQLNDCALRKKQSRSLSNITIQQLIHLPFFSKVLNILLYEMT